MKKKTLLPFACIVLLLLVATIWYLVSSQIQATLLPEEGSEAQESSIVTNKKEFPRTSSLEEGQGFSEIPPVSAPSKELFRDVQADSLYNSFGKLGAEYRLHSRAYRQGEVQEEKDLLLGWNGDMLLTVNSVKVLNYPPAGEYQEEVLESWANQKWKNPCVLRFSISLTNEDAENLNAIRYQFHSTMFHLNDYEDLIPENWAIESDGQAMYYTATERYGAADPFFSGKISEEDKWIFNLEPGQTTNFILSFAVEREYLTANGPFLGISLSRRPSAGIILEGLEGAFSEGEVGA